MVMTIIFIARTCHEVNRAYCIALGDHSQKPWEELDEETQNSAIQGVEFVLSDPTATPEDSHTSWTKYKLDHGWTWGPEKNGDLKTHPCLVPYSELPLEQRVKDHLFQAVVKSLRA